jgi:hypothetical protein
MEKAILSDVRVENKSKQLEYNNGVILAHFVAQLAESSFALITTISSITLKTQTSLGSFLLVWLHSDRQRSVKRNNVVLGQPAVA